jgi:hypothetical protein
MLGRNDLVAMFKFKKVLNYLCRYTKITCSSFFYILKGIFYDILWKAALQTIKVAITAAIPAYGLYLFYVEKIDSFTIDIFNIYILTPLVILIAFSSLFFNRARAFTSEDKRHICSIIAAEHALKGGIFYSAAIVWGFVITSIYLIFNLDGISIPTSLLKSLYIPSLVLVYLAYIELYLSVCEIWPSLNNDLKNNNR